MQREKNFMKYKVTFGRLLNYDIRNSIIQNRWRWIGAIALFFFLTYVITNNFQLLREEVGIGGIFLYLLKGAAPYTRTENSQFELPILWLLYHIYFFYLIGEYPVKDLQGYGKQVFFLISNRRKWWLSKCIWVMMSAVIYEVLFLMVSFLYLVVTSHDIYIQMDIVCQVIGMRTVVTAAWGMLVYLEAMIWMGWFQFYLSLIMHPVLATLVTLTLLICACYFYMPLFPCNLMMLTRTCQVDRNGLFLLSGSIILTISSAILVWCGANFMKKYPLMK